MDAFGKAAIEIIKTQEGIIGPLALEQAEQVDGLKVDWAAKTATFSGDEGTVLGKLVEQYKEFFGQTSVEVCKDAVREIMHQVPGAQVPSALR